MSRTKAALFVLALGASNALLLAPEGSSLRVAAALFLLLLPGLAWAELLLPDAERLLRWTIGAGLGFALAILTGMLLHYLPGPVALWQVLAAVDLQVIAPVLLLLFTRSSPAGSFPEQQSIYLVLLLLMMLAGGVFRFAELGYSEFQGDEIEAVVPAARAIQGYPDALTLQRRKAPGEVLLPMLMWRTIGTLDEGQARLPFALAGMLAIPTCYLMGRRLLDTRAGLSAAALVALCGLLTAFSRIVQYQAIVVWMMALAMLCAWQWRDSFRLRWAALTGIFFGIGLLAHYDAIVVMPALVYIALTAIWPSRVYTRQAVSKTIIASVVMLACSGLVASLFYVPYSLVPQNASTRTYLATRVGAELIPNNLANFLHTNIVYSSFYFVLIAGLLALGFLCWTLQYLPALERLPNGRRWAPAIAAALLGGLLLWPKMLTFGYVDLAAGVFALILAGALFSKAVTANLRAVLIWGGSAFLTYVFFVLTPGTHVYVIMLPWALIAGFAAAKLWSGMANRQARALALAASLAAILLFGGYLYMVYLRQDVEFWQDWPASRSALYWAPDAYAAPRGISIFGMVHRTGWKTAGQLYADGRLEGAYDSSEKPEVTVWYTRNAPRPSQEEQAFCGSKPQNLLIADDTLRHTGADVVDPNLLSANYRMTGRVTQGNGKSLTIYQAPPSDAPMEALDGAALASAFDRATTPATVTRHPRPAHIVNANFGNQIRLLGYDLDCVTAEGRVALTLYWQALAQVGADYHTFVHVEGGLGEHSPAGVWGQSDGAPGADRTPMIVWNHARLMTGQPDGGDPYPTSTWSSGQIVIDRHSFTTSTETPPGDYALVVGLYELDTGKRLTVLDKGGNPVADYVKLTDIQWK